MNMYSFLDENSLQTKSLKDLEILLAGNICRCTGYRPILDAFRSFVTINDNEPNPCPVRYISWIYIHFYNVIFFIGY